MTRGRQSSVRKYPFGSVEQRYAFHFVLTSVCEMLYPFHLLAILAAFCILGTGCLKMTPEREFYIQDQKRQGVIGYGPGLAVYGPWSYVDLSYNNIPFVGKIPIFGKDGTSSKLGISPFYPPNGNPSNPMPPLYRARPLPPHVPEPVEVVAVPLDEEALHGEPLFPKELILPGALEMAGDPDEKKDKEDKVKEPFGGINLDYPDDEKASEKDAHKMEGFIHWPDLGTPEKVTSERPREMNKDRQDKDKPHDPFGFLRLRRTQLM
uniref:COesterase domain-containing protein n=1 Tax=Steinernema glaseri TaxID=37863 RepID=A0A1I7YQH1_9BILA